VSDGEKDVLVNEGSDWLEAIVGRDHEWNDWTKNEGGSEAEVERFPMGGEIEVEVEKVDIES